jgi:hypothetical protein
MKPNSTLYKRSNMNIDKSLLLINTRYEPETVSEHFLPHSAITSQKTGSPGAFLLLKTLPKRFAPPPSG